MILGSGESTATKRSSRTQKKYHFNEVLVTNLRFKKLLEDSKQVSFQRGFARYFLAILSTCAASGYTDDSPLQRVLAQLVDDSPLQRVSAQRVSSKI